MIGIFASRDAVCNAMLAEDLKATAGALGCDPTAALATAVRIHRETGVSWAAACRRVKDRMAAGWVPTERSAR